MPQHNLVAVIGLAILNGMFPGPHSCFRAPWPLVSVFSSSHPAAVFLAAPSLFQLYPDAGWRSGRALHERLRSDGKSSGISGLIWLVAVAC
jgi:hypothetical protein